MNNIKCRPEALVIADALELLDTGMCSPRDGAAELRRQHAEIERLTKANEGQTRMNVTLVMENSELIRERDALRAQQPPAQPVKRLTDEQIRDVLLSASRDAAVKLGVPADELGEPDEESLRSATMVARWVEPAMAAAWGVKLEG